MKFFFSFLYLLPAIFGCSSSKPATEGVEKITQGIDGYVHEVSGNQMPSPDIKPVPPKGVRTTVYVYERTNITQTQRVGTSPFYQRITTNFVQSVESDSTGHFALSLPPGNYSLFTKVRGQFYANNFDAQNNIAPVQVEEKKLTKVNILISANATF